MVTPRVLVIAGSDCSGGAGLEADQKVLAVHGCYAMTATTALTAQNTLGVQDVHVTPPSFVAKQINSCLDDIKADVVKIGRELLFPAYMAITLSDLRLRHAGLS
jgi:hydroxymethylpyrimidine kinase/phosphomethylpyrimidine kinase